MTESFETWIASGECYPVLEVCARLVIRRAAAIGLQLDDTYQNAAKYLQAVTAQLWQHLRENAPSLAEKGTALLLTGDEAGFVAYLSQGFISDCLDRRRTDSPFHAYYRHMRAVLSKAEGIFYVPRPADGSYYACSCTANLDFLPEEPDGRDYAGWAQPSVPFSLIHRNREMVILARFFRDESLRQIFAEYLLPIRELVRFVAFSYPLLTTVDTVAKGSAGDGDAPATEGVEHRMAVDAREEAWQRQRHQLELDVIDSQLETLARDCVAELSHRQRRALSLHDQDFTLEEIARQLGEKGASNVHYHLKTARSVLRRRWSLWGPPVLRQFTEVDEEEFFLFYEKVISFCKDGAEGRG